MSVGLDIGTNTIKVVELEQNNNKFSLKASGVIGYRGVYVEKLADERSIADMAEVIKKLFKAANVSKKDIVISLPENLVFTRAIKLPILTDQEVSAAIKWEAEQYIPIPLNEAIIQHQIIERVSTGPTPEVTVLLVAAPRALVKKYVDLLSAAKLRVVTVETELMSMVRSLAPSNQTALVIDYGARSVDVAIAKNGMLVFSRSISSAGEALTRALNQSLGITLQEAEEYKRTYGMSSGHLDGKIRGALEPIVGGVINEIKKAIHFYQTEEKGQLPTSTIVSGGVAGMPEFISYLTKSIGNEVLIANPFANIQVPKEVWSNLSAYSPLYSVAVGLAMR